MTYSRYATLAVAALIAAAGAAKAQAPTITITPSIGPTDSSAYDTTWRTNSAYAQLTGAQVYGIPNTPGFYAAIPTGMTGLGYASPWTALVTGPMSATGFTGYNSWLGSPTPGTTYGPAFANEYGNQLFFGVKVAAPNNGSTVNLGALTGLISYNTASGLSGTVNGGGIPPTFNNVNAFGFNYGPNGTYIPVTSGSTADIIVLPGFFVAWTTNQNDPNAITAIEDALGQLPGYPGPFYGYNYSALFNYPGAIPATATVLSPEPTSLAIWGGLGLLGAISLLRRRKRAMAA